MRAVMYTLKHYPEIKKWWLKQGHHIVPERYLSTRGVVIEQDGKPIAACWLYVTDAAFCLFDHAVVSPEIRRKERSKAMDLCTDTLLDIAKGMGFERAILITKTQSLISRLKRHGFKVLSNDTSMLVRGL